MTLGMDMLTGQNFTVDTDTLIPSRLSELTSLGPLLLKRVIRIV